MTVVENAFVFGLSGRLRVSVCGGWVGTRFLGQLCFSSLVWYAVFGVNFRGFAQICTFCGSGIGVLYVCVYHKFVGGYDTHAFALVGGLCYALLLVNVAK